MPYLVMLILKLLPMMISVINFLNQLINKLVQHSENSNIYVTNQKTSNNFLELGFTYSNDLFYLTIYLV